MGNESKLLGSVAVSKGKDKAVKRQTTITWWHDPDTGKVIVDIPHCKDACKLLELGEAICEACFIDCNGQPVTNPVYKIEIKDGKLLIPCTTTDFDISTAIIDGVECPDKLVITPCGKNPLPPIWLNPVREINGKKPDKQGRIHLPDCCHYQDSVDTAIDPHCPPKEPPEGIAGADKLDGDTLHLCHTNGSCYYTCVDGAWVLDYCKVDQVGARTAFVVAPEGECIDPQNPATALSDDLLAVLAAAGNVCSPGNTLVVCYENATCYYTAQQVERECTCTCCCKCDCACECKAACDCPWVCEWTLDFCKFDCCHAYAESAEVIDFDNPPTPPIKTEKVSEGSTLHVCHPNGSCYYTCIGGVWVLEFCKKGITQTIFKAGDTLPTAATNIIDICLDPEGQDSVTGGDTLPDNLLGCVLYDCITDCLCYAPPKVVESCDDIKTTAALPAHDFPGCEVRDTSYDLNFAEVGTWQMGENVRVDDTNPIDPVLINGGSITIPVPPVSQAGCMLIANIASGAAVENGVVSQSSALGDVMLSNATQGTSLTKIKDTSSTYGWESQFYCMLMPTTTGGTVDLSLPNVDAASYNALQNDSVGGGVIQIVWTEVCRSDNTPMAKSDISAADATCEAGIRGDGTTGEYVADQGCDLLVLANGRHIQHPGNADTTNQITPSDWVQPTNSAVTELYDYTSRDLTNEDATPCQLGTAGFVIPEGQSSAFNYQHNSSDQQIEGNYFIAFPVNCAQLVCEGENTPYPPQQFVITPECDAVVTKDITVDNIEFETAPGDEIRLVPVINGSPYPAGAVSSNNSGGTATLSETASMGFSYAAGNAAEGVPLDCEVAFIVEVLQGDGVMSSVFMPAGDICISATEA